MEETTTPNTPAPQAPAPETPRKRWVRPAQIALALGVLTAGIALAATTVGSHTDPSGAGAPSAGSSVPTAAATPAQSDSESDGSKPTTPAKPIEVAAPRSGPVSGDQQVEVTRASAAATSVVDSLNQIGERADGSADGLDQVATGFALGELQSQAQQQRDLGYRQTGEAKVTAISASKVNLAGQQPAMTLNVCVDISNIDVIDGAGKSHKKDLYNPGRPVRHVYGAVFEKNVWKIATHDIPNEQNCEKA